MPIAAPPVHTPRGAGARNPWPNCASLPRGPAAVLAALHLSDPQSDPLARLTDGQWRDALAFSDRWALTLALRNRAAATMPLWVRERTDENAAHNRERHQRLEELYRTLAGRLDAAGIEFLALKGLTHCPDFGSRPEERTQCDVDLYIPGEDVYRAQDAVRALGYESMNDLEDFPTGHLPSLILKNGWQWRGDYFDPEIPVGIELHYEFWNDDVERLPVPDADDLWRRRVKRAIAGTVMPVLCPVDGLAYAALHLLKHVLRGSARPFHVYEVARFLDLRVGDSAFWEQWRKLHSSELRRLEAVMFRLAAAWFGGALHRVPEEEVGQLPAATQAWFDEFALSPAAGLFRSNKDELWLHLSLLNSRRDRWSVAKRRLFPERLPGPVDATHIPESEMRWHRRALKGLRYTAYLASRLRHHAAALPRLAISGA
ncbi:MAG TPA: nucleotidyltransferase family protein, partial [Bryobacteraceae bacterium]